MKTISDIREKVEHLELMDRFATMESEKKYKAKIFKEYDGVKEIQDVLSNLENLTGGEYFIEQGGDLCYGIELDKEISSLPEIGSYLTQDFAFYIERDKKLCQFMGSFISIDWNHDRNCYFIYDHDSRKPILEKRPDIDGHPTISEESYVAAKIEQYQRQKGEFSDLIITDRYGSYVKHFDTGLGNETEEEINKIVDQYENQGEEE